MRKLLLVFVLLIFFHRGFSQSFEITNIDSVKIYTDAMVKSISRKMRYSSTTYNKTLKEFCINYISNDLYDDDLHYTNDVFVNQKNHKKYIGVYFVFAQYPEAGRTRYVFLETKGRLDDMLQIWKAHFNVSADEQKIRSNNEERATLTLPNGTERHYEIYGGGDNRTIFRIE